MRVLRACLRDRTGAAALEFALIMPLLAALLLLAADGWLRTSQVSNMRAALQTGTRYYQTGGTDDELARVLALQAWTHSPGDAALTVVRSCTCGDIPSTCSSLCSNSDPPSAFINLSATGTFAGLVKTTPLAQHEVLRVR